MKKQVGYNVLASVLFSIISMFFTFCFQFSFNFESEKNDQYYLIWILPFALLVHFLFLIKRKSVFTISHLQIFASMILVCTLLSQSSLYSFGNEHFFATSSIYIMLVTIFLLCEKLDFRFIFLPILILFFYELLTGLDQAFSTGANLGDVNDIQGHLQNSGIYSCYLVIHTPILYFVLFQWDKWRAIAKASTEKERRSKLVNYCKVVGFGLLVISIILLLLKTNSRTAMISMLVILGSGVLTEYGEVLQKRIRRISPLYRIFLLLLFLAGAGIYLYHLFFLKRLSAIGRLMKIRITLDNFPDYFWFGTGLGRFSWYYPQWQSEYFQKTLEVPLTYYLGAGESYILFNEIIQLFAEVGIFGFIFIGIVFYLFFSSKSPTNFQVLKVCKLTVIGILACGLTSYPFHVNILLAIMGACFLVVFSVKENRVRYFVPRKYLGIVVLSVCVLACTVYKGLLNYFAFENFNKLINQETTGTDISYSKVNQILYDNGKFLTEYGISLMNDSADYNSAIDVFKGASKIFISRKSTENFATCYLKLKNYEDAKLKYEWLGNYLPNQCRVQHSLLKIAQLKLDYNEERKIARKILLMPVKIPSEEVTRIKMEAEEVLK